MMKKYKIFCGILFAFFILNSIGVKAQVNNDSLVNVAFGKVAQKDLLGGVSSVNVTELLKKEYATYSLDNLQSFVGGYNGNIWGQAPLILVDGIPRAAGDIRFVEVETITVLKGASAVILYGSTASKGVVLITTKRGTNSPMVINVRANAGTYVPKGYPSYLNAANYMKLYNEAGRNDGNTSDKYSADTIAKTAAGTNPYKYPDINFYSSDYLKKAYMKTDLTAEISGGDKRTRYYTNIGLAYNNDIMNYGYQKNNKDFAFDVRANVDMNISKWLNASTDFVANVSDNYTGRGNFWASAATLRPNNNWLSPLIPISMLDTTNASINTAVAGSNHIIDGKYLLGGTTTDQTNAFSDMLAAGYVKNKNRRFLFNMNLAADLGSVLTGLSFKTVYSMDYSAFYSEGYNLGYSVYQPTWSVVGGKDNITGLTQINTDGASSSEFVGKTSYTQTISLRSQFNYDRTFAKKHNVSAALLGWGYLTQSSSDANNGSSTYQPSRMTNLGFQAAYNFSQKYYFDFSAALVHSAKLPEGKRNAISPSVSIGWRISDESFFKDNVSFVDNLKLTASYAIIKQDIDIYDITTSGGDPYYLYQGYYNNTGGWYQWRDGVAGGWTTMSVRGDNPNLTFIKRKEFRVGLDGSLFKNLISLDANYFSQNTDGLLTRGSSTIFPSYYTGNGSYLPYLNYNIDNRSGLDLALNLNKKIGQIKYSIGVTGMYLSSQAVRRDEVYQDAYQNRAGKPLDSYWGYISDGFFQSQADIDSHAKQTIGGTLKPGDLKYRDVNNDGVVDGKDQVNLGKNGWAGAPLTLGVNLTLKYKNFTLFALGSGNWGAIGFKNSSYYWVNGAAKYSDAVLGRWTEATKNTATYPRLTTTAASNNFQNSTFWMYKTNVFRISRVQLSYDFNANCLKNSIVHGLSVYILGDNLLTISKEHKLMDTNIGSAPQYRFYNFGVRASF